MSIRPAHMILVCLTLLLLAGCSSMRLAYNNLNWIIDWYLDDYLSLNSSQQDFYEQRMDALLEWHRSDELPRYCAFLEQLRLEMAGRPSPALLRQRYDTLRDFFRRIMQQAAPDCAGLLLRLDPQQRRDLYAALKDKQEKLEKKYLQETPSERQLRQRKRAEKTLKRFVGALTDEQKALLGSWAGEMVPTQRLWLENRRTWQERLRQLLEDTAPEDERRPALERLFAEPEHLWAPAYRSGIQVNESATISMLAGLLADLNDSQKKHLETALADMINDFRRLALPR